MDNQIFSKTAAIRFGLSAGVILSRLNYRVCRNRANGKHLHNGRYWMYQSARSWHEEMPYLSEVTISKILRKLVSEGVIMTGNFNKFGMDRTLWYTLTDEGEALFAAAGTQTDAAPVPTDDTPDMTNDTPDTTDAFAAAAVCDPSKSADPSVKNTAAIPVNTSVKKPVNTTVTVSSNAGVPADTGHPPADDPAAPNREDTEIILPLRDKKQRRITPEEIGRWERMYPKVDIMTELYKMRGWLESHPARRRDRTGIDPFIHKWFARCLDIVRADEQTQTIFYASEEDFFG